MGEEERNRKPHTYIERFSMKGLSLENKILYMDKPHRSHVPETTQWIHLDEMGQARSLNMFGPATQVRRLARYQNDIAAIRKTSLWF